MTQEEFLAEAKRRFGDDPYRWAFRCPACGTVQTAQSFVDAGFPKGTGEINRYLGFTCIGRFKGEGDEGIAAKNAGRPWSRGCNWTLGGLLRIHTLEILYEGKKHPHFELAPEPQAEASSQTFSPADGYRWKAFAEHGDSDDLVLHYGRGEAVGANVLRDCKALRDLYPELNEWGLFGLWQAWMDFESDYLLVSGGCGPTRMDEFLGYIILRSACGFQYDDFGQSGGWSSHVDAALAWRDRGGEQPLRSRRKSETVPR